MRRPARPTLRVRRDWAMLIAAVLVVLGIVALTGGFAEAAAGRRTALPDESVTTARWTFGVHRAELTDRTPTGTRPTRSSGSS
ncbi:MAG: hypothetical protein HZY73_14885 [Micropruina sp.]|nr:MAG: hypothetical protein HZY73_14885 [Micropruina sp.]